MCERYCGFWFFPCWLRPTYFNSACKWHDEYYGESSTLSRRNADRLFLEDMLEIVEIRNGGRLRRANAYLFYYLVRLFGWISYRR